MPLVIDLACKLRLRSFHVEALEEGRRKKFGGPPDTCLSSPRSYFFEPSLVLSYPTTFIQYVGAFSSPPQSRHTSSAPSQAGLKVLLTATFLLSCRFFTSSCAARLPVQPFGRQLGLRCIDRVTTPEREHNHILRRRRIAQTPQPTFTLI